MANNAGTRLKQALTRPEVVLIPGGFSPLMARMLEKLEFEAMFMAGSQTNAYVYGLPDVGLISMREMVDNARRITAVSDIPVFMDGDTGFGNVLNVHRTVREAAAAGVAMISIEDQEAPKKSGTSAGRRCISEEEALGKIRAAVAARDDAGSDMLICARTDLIGSEGGSYEIAIDRSVKFVKEARADVVWINTVETKEQMAEACRTIPGPVIPLYGGPPTAPSPEEWQVIGAAGVLYPAMTTSPGTQAVWEFLNDFKERGLAAQQDQAKRSRASKWGQVNLKELFNPDSGKIEDLESNYLPQEQQRDYEGTWGHGPQA